VRKRLAAFAGTVRRMVGREPCACRNDHQGETRRLMAKIENKRAWVSEHGHGCHDCAYKNNKRLNMRGSSCRSLTCFTCQEGDHWTAPNATLQGSPEAQRKEIP